MASRRRWRQSIARLLLGLTVLQSPSFAQTPPAPLPQLQFEVSEGTIAHARRLAGVELAGLARFAHAIGLEGAGAPIRVVLASEASELGRTTPHWIAGFAVDAADTVVLFPGRSPSYPYDTLEDVLRHEIAHILVARRAPGAMIPRWFHEGLALSVERRWGFGDQTRVALATLSGPPSIASLDADFAAGEARMARAYGLAGAVVRDLIARHGPELPGQVLAGLSAGASFDAAFAAAAGVPFDIAERAFWRGRWWGQLVPLLTSSLALWAGIIALAVQARRRRRAARAALRRRWEEEEQRAAASATDTGPPPDAARDAPAPSGQ